LRLLPLRSLRVAPRTSHKLHGIHETALSACCACGRTSDMQPVVWKLAQSCQQAARGWLMRAGPPVREGAERPAAAWRSCRPGIRHRGERRRVICALGRIVENGTCSATFALPCGRATELQYGVKDIQHTVIQLWLACVCAATAVSAQADMRRCSDVLDLGQRSS
jgi:hypothetical protein